MLALKKGWVPNGNLNKEEITDACHKEDNGFYQCVGRRDQLAKIIRQGVDYMISTGDIDLSGVIANLTNSTGDLKSHPTITELTERLPQI